MKKCRFLAMMSVCLILTLTNFTNTGLTEVFANPEETVVSDTEISMPEGSGQLESDGGDGSTSFTSTLPEEQAEEEIVEEETGSAETEVAVQEPFAKTEAPKKNYFFGYIILIIITATVIISLKTAHKKIKQKESKSKYNPEMMYNPLKAKLK